MKRIESVDVLRIVAIVSVIVIHTAPFATEDAPVGRYLNMATLVQMPTRFAVPFFFIVAGYFWSHKCALAHQIYAPTVSILRRLTILFLAWSAIYLLESNVFDSYPHGPPLASFQQFNEKLLDVLSKPPDFLLVGTKIHLWFLPALMCSIAIASLLLRYKQSMLLTVLAIALFLVGLAGKAYSSSPIGFVVNFNFRDGPFFSLVFFVTGYFLHQIQPRTSWFRTGLLIALFGFLLQFVELVLLNRLWGTVTAQDFVIGTYFFGLGVAMIALSDSRHLGFPGAVAIGPLVLGIYASHYIFIDIFRPTNQIFAGNWLWAIAYVVAVFSMSFVLSKLLMRFALTRRLVM
ncbi:MAG: acyltransferase [Pseudomonadota bacterium]